MMRIAALASLLLLSLPVESRADPVQSPVVVELFTSQGCASCPPADALMHKLAQRDDILALALHVDYWDYIGWKDIFGDPAFTRRQKAYARAMGHRMIHTPQMIVMGQEDVEGADPMQLADAIMRHQTVPRPVSLRLEPDNEGLKITLHALSDMPKEGAVVELVRYAPLQRVAITRGELAGRTLDYANIVEDWQRLAEWDGAQGLEITVPLPRPLPGGQSVAVLVQQAGNGPILAAARLD